MEVSFRILVRSRTCSLGFMKSLAPGKRRLRVGVLGCWRLEAPGAISIPDTRSKDMVTDLIVADLIFEYCVMKSGCWLFRGLDFGSFRLCQEK